MTTRARRRLVAVLAFAVAVLAAGGFAGYQAWNRRTMLRTTLAWARLAPLPPSCRNFTISTGGSMFTRSFRASFVAPPPDIARWLLESPGTRGVEPERPDSLTRYFRIAPGGGAQFAEVTVDDRTGAVLIRVYWS